MLEVREQTRLSWRRMLAICADSLAYRLFRSLVTVGIIVLAIAFLGQILFDGYFGRALRDSVDAEARATTADARFLRRAGFVETPTKLARAWASLRPEDADFQNLRRWLGGTPAETEGLVASCARLDAFLHFLDRLPAGKRSLLVGELDGWASLDRLQDDAARAEFLARLARMKSLRPPGGEAGVVALARAWPALSSQILRAREGYRETVDAIAARCGADGLNAALGAALRANRERELFDELARLGFEVAPSEVAWIARSRRQGQETDWAVGFLKAPELRAAWYREFQSNLNPFDALDVCARSASRVKWIQKNLSSENAARFDAGRFLAAARAHRERSALLHSQQALLNRYGATERFSEKTLWLIVVSLLVCVVGITNAMLMSVLERFKEIATMKCLGARNQTIAFLFILESAAMGVAGGFLGLGIGAGIALVRQTWEFGGRLFANFPWADALVASALCLGCSILLAAIAAIYPAGVAARMAPMEAMRVD
ncbi:MAG: ABC transporter permease [Verrucomicrobiae bacterium]|nr:ABC transporter permease [Verrucomicrobiae bacterium]